MGIVSQGQTKGARAGYAARAQSATNASRTDSPGKHSHGIDIGAARNTAQEKFAANRSELEKKKREAEVARRNREAEQRKKDAAAMTKKDTVSEGRYSSTDTKTLQGIHQRAHSDISKPENKKLTYSHPGFADRIDAEHGAREELKKRGINVDRPKHSAVIEETGTEARSKVKNVARPDDAAPTSEKSKLAKQAEIKNKIIEERPLMSDRNLGLPASLILAARGIMEKKGDEKLKGGKTEVDLDPETDDKQSEDDAEAKGKDKKKSKKPDDDDDEDDDKKSMKEGKEHTVPKTDKEKKLAALATPKDKITHKDVLVGRGVVKEEEKDTPFEGPYKKVDTSKNPARSHLKSLTKQARKSANDKKVAKEEVEFSDAEIARLEEIAKKFD